MTENERVKEIRKDNKLSMEKFGESLGVSGAAISMIESGERNVSTQIEMLICSKYDINETWLRTGEGEMKAEPPEDEIDAVIKKYDLPEEVRVMLEQFVKLRTDHQEIIADYIESVAASLRGDTPAASTDSSDTSQKPAASSAPTQKPAARAASSNSSEKPNSPRTELTTLGSTSSNQSEIPTGSSVPDHLKLTEEEKRLHADLQRDIDTRKATDGKVSSGSASTGK